MKNRPIQSLLLWFFTLLGFPFHKARGTTVDRGDQHVTDLPGFFSPSLFFSWSFFNSIALIQILEQLLTKLLIAVEEKNTSNELPQNQIGIRCTAFAHTAGQECRFL